MQIKVVDKSIQYCPLSFMFDFIYIPTYEYQKEVQEDGYLVYETLKPLSQSELKTRISFCKGFKSRLRYFSSKKNLKIERHNPDAKFELKE